MPTVVQLRDLATRMLALAMQVKDQQLLEQLCARAGEYLDQAGQLETAQQPATDTEKKKH
jgi:hypothetical protein